MPSETSTTSARESARLAGTSKLAAQQQIDLAEKHKETQLAISEAHQKARAKVAQAHLDNARDARLSNEVLEMTKLFVGAGKNPAEARKLAMDAVHGPRDA
jgi:hypothetical protein